MDKTRQTILADRSGWDPSEWMEIPSVTWHSNEPLVLEDARELIKNLLWMVIAGLPQAEPSGPPLEFVVLLRLRLGDDETTVSIVSPRPESLRWLAASVDGSLNAEQQAAISARVEGIEVQHKYGFADGTTVPVVVSVEPTTGAVLLMNHNHLSNPDQFLSPWLCRTTSGFLNFIGAQSIAYELQGRREIGVSNLDHIVGQGLDEWIRWLYCAMESGELLQTERLLIDRRDVERYVYQYFGDR